MSMGPVASRLPGDRLHLQHGPIDLIIGVEGPEREACYRAAAQRFETVLTGLVAELPALRTPLTDDSFRGPIAQRMVRAVAPYQQVFVTPMAAVAGAVADEVLAAMLRDHSPAKAYVNNGGDIALHLAPQSHFSVLGPAGEITVRGTDTARGIATSGWQGRSHSLGIADAVTVLARTAAAADVAATLIANAIDLPEHPTVIREPAQMLSSDSDLGDRLVTTHVGALTKADITKALNAGRRLAAQCAKRGLIESAVLCLQSQITTLDNTDALGALAHA